MRRLFLAALMVAGSTTIALAQAAPANPLRRPAATPAVEAAPPAQAPRAAESPAPKVKAKTRSRATTGDYAERRKRCSGEWAAAKSSNTTNGQKWPQFFSACNTRLKAAGV
ncbi:MAG: hypothetical protein J0H41_18390 [Rhizobiales bacterium]|nr:hypothetical protein [Hyphomicrobiales bacterium]